MKFKYKEKKYRTRKWVDYVGISTIAGGIFWSYLIWYFPI